jgi:biopolymer transport protein ExbD
MRIPTIVQDMEGPDLTPVIDVVFLLLLFFLVATQFSTEVFELDTRRPNVVKARPLASGTKQIVVNIDADGIFRLAGNAMSEQELQAYLHAQQTTNPDMQTVLINADERVPFRYPAQVMGVCEGEKIRHSCAVDERLSR